MEKSLNYILRWINFTLNISLSSFPGSIIESNGELLGDLINHLTGKSLKFFSYDSMNNSIKNNRIETFAKQYENLIKYLKEHGALLNTIRPHYLLGFNDFMSFLKNFSDEESYFRKKMTEKKFWYLSNDSWITLFYQIIKIFYLAKINMNSFLKNNQFPQNIIPIPKFYTGFINN